MGHQNLLQNIYLFKSFSEEQLGKVNAIAEMITYQPGDEVFAEKSIATAVYVIRFGSVRIIQKSEAGENVEIAVLGIGSHFGEMPFVDSEPRSASAVCIERAEIIALQYKSLEALLSTDVNISAKFYKNLSHFLTGRLRITTQDLSFAREKNLSHF